jgi:hypothetical protein
MWTSNLIADRFPSDSVFTGTRKLFESQLKNHLNTFGDTAPGLKNHFTADDINMLVPPMWDEWQEKKPFNMREPWTGKHLKDACIAWSGSSNSVINGLRQESSGHTSLSPLNSIRTIMTQINKHLNVILAPTGALDGKKFVTPRELDAIIAEIIGTATPPLEPTYGDMREAYRFWSPSGKGTKSAREGASVDRNIVSLIKEGIRNILKEQRRRKTLTNPLIPADKAQLLAATLEALNDHEHTNHSVLRPNIAKAVVEWAVDKGNDQGVLYLGTVLNR